VQSAKSTGMRVAITYAVAAAAWIVVSSTLAFDIQGVNPQTVEFIKGLAFVGVTAAVLYFSVMHSSARFQAQLKKSASAERVLEQVVVTVPIGVLLTTEDRVITFMNPAAEQILGMAGPDAVGHTLEELCCSGDDSRAAGDLGELLRTGAVDGLTLGRADDSTPRALVARAAPVDPQVPSAGWVVAIADVTASYRDSVRTARLVDGYRFLADALVACGRAVNEYQLLQQICGLAVERGGYFASWALVVDSEGALVDACRHGMGAHARETADLVLQQARSTSAAIVSELESGRIQVSNDIARDPANPWYASTEEGLASSAAFAAVGSSGILATITLFSDEPGRFDAPELEILRSLQSALSFALEKTALDRRRFDAEEALGRSENEYRKLFEGHPQPMWIYDLETLRFLAVNDAAVSKYGFSADEFAAMTIADIRPANEIPRLLTNVAHVTEGLEDAGVWTHRDKSGREFPVHIYSHTMDWEGRPAELVMVMEVARIE